MSEGHRTPALTGAQIGHILQAMADSFGQQLRSPIPRAPGTVAVGVVLHRQRLRSDPHPGQVHDDVLTEPSDVQTMFDNIPVADQKLQWIHGTTCRWDGYLEFQRHAGPMLEWFATHMYLGERAMTDSPTIAARRRHAWTTAQPATLEVFGSFLRILAVSDHEDERGGHGRSPS
jgi:hypothetical protein